MAGQVLDRSTQVHGGAKSLEVLQTTLMSYQSPNYMVDWKFLLQYYVDPKGMSLLTDRERGKGQ